MKRARAILSREAEADCVELEEDREGAVEEATTHAEASLIKGTRLSKSSEIE